MTSATIFAFDAPLTSTRMFLAALMAFLVSVNRQVSRLGA